MTCPNRSRRFEFDDSGQGLVEYSLIMAVVALGLVAMLLALRNSTGDAFEQARSGIDQAAACAGGTGTGCGSETGTIGGAGAGGTSGQAGGASGGGNGQVNGGNGNGQGNNGNGNGNGGGNGSNGKGGGKGNQ